MTIPMDPSKFRSSKVALEDLERVKGPELKLKYIEDYIDRVNREEIQIADKTREHLYDAAVAIYEELEIKERLQYAGIMRQILNSATTFENAQGNQVKSNYYKEVLDNLVPSQQSHGLERRIAHKAVAVLLCGGLIFMARNMTGHVTSNASSISSEIVSSLLIGILAMGIVWIAASRMTAKS